MVPGDFSGMREGPGENGGAAESVLMNIIIVGAGEIGRYLATELSRESHTIAVIESNPGLAAALERCIDA